MAAVAAAQKNREMFAIKKSYSIEVCNYLVPLHNFKVDFKIIEDLKSVMPVFSA